MSSIGDLAVLAFVVAVPAILAALAISLLVRDTVLTRLGGLLLLATAALVPLLFAYAWPLGIAGAVLGGAAAALRSGRGLGTLHRVLLIVAVLSLVGLPAGILEASRIQIDETFDRCAGDRAVAAIEHSRAAGRGYPANVGEIALEDGGSIYSGSCYIGSGTNWLYRVTKPGTYTVGYWVDWSVIKHVCLHSAGSQGWSCGFERWGPFRPGEMD
ncbi:MAG TPA: hypothetical protein VNF91_05225 [Candidatus Acidoferrum sp.]|nr:hypothetical protein [Candidatus Acidoferrum sp.]